MEFPMIEHTYLLALPEAEQANAGRLVHAALERARAKHSDFERFAPAIEFLSRNFFSCHNTMPLDDYIETLYCGVKHGDFSRSWRAHLRKAPAAAARQQ